METFLKQTARRILAAHPVDTDRVLVVFNNHRSELFMRRAFERLSDEEDKSFFMPKMTVIDDLVADLGGMKIEPNEFLLFELYRIHVEIGGRERKYSTFEEFMAFGDVMLGDFSEIDRYCVDARQLFVNLHDIKHLLEWDVENPAMSPFQSDYLAFYHSLYDYYRLLREHLIQKGVAYSGMAYRHVAENIATLADGCPYDKIYFVGFNAISECERRIMLEYSRRGIGVLFTDGDSYYFDDETQEAGYFLRHNSRYFDELGHFGPSLFGQGKKKITIVECPEAVMQCKYAGCLLDEHSDWLTDPESTAVVLADESLLLPVLNALPETTDDYKVNVSMGFSYADSGINMLVLRLLSLYRRATAQGYYHADVVEVLADYHIGRLLGTTGLRQKAMHFLAQENRIRCGASEVKALASSDKLDFLFPAEPPAPGDVLAILRRLAEALVAAGTVENNKKEKQALGGLAEILDYFGRLQADYSYITDLSTLEKVYSRIAQRHTINFLGKPLSGLQILGMLETRNLDFRRVVLLSANEGTLPAGRSQNTLIPYELQHHFGLPTYAEKDSVYAYNFYRLLQRADEVYLLYSSASESMGKGEASRFIRQVVGELAPRFASNIELQRMVVGASAALHRGAPMPDGRKTEAVMQRLALLAGRGFSPTALGDYVECPLRYYYVNVLGVDEPDTLQEDIDASQLGSCVHKVLEWIYSPYKGRALEAEGLRRALANLPQLMQEAFDKLYSHGRSAEGRNRFIYSVGESQVRHLLKRELALVDGGTHIEVVQLELELRMPLAEGVGIKGVVDRIDRVDGTLRIIDYKTGRVADDEIAVSTAELDEGKPMPRKWLQLMCYLLLYTHDHPTAEPLTVGIYPLRSLQSGVRLATVDGNSVVDAAALAAFRERIAALTAEIMNPDVPFAAPDKPQGCAFCPVASFCPAKV